jgi:signal transduction histidine kinase
MKDALSGLRHSARGCLNAVKLCVSALELDCTREEQIEFIEDVIRGSDKMCQFIDDLAAYFDAHPAESVSNV